MTTPRIVFEPYASGGLTQLIRDKIAFHNVAATGVSEYYDLAFFLKDENDEVLGGLIGDVWGGWLHVAFLWVAPPLRGQSYGSDLLQAAEEYAVRRGARTAYLETHSFQARPFYEKHGYEVFGMLEDFPPGHAKYFLRKSLQRCER